MKIFKSFLILILTLPTCAFSQNKRFVEEVALYHLDSLIKTEPAFKAVQYYTTGYLLKSKTGVKDTVESFTAKNSVKTMSLQTVFKDVVMLENDKLNNFQVDKRAIKNKNYDALNIYHFLKANNLYYVFFDIQGTYGGTNILIVMDLKGNMVRYKLSSYKN
jgi:hypothetical protein